MIRSLFLATVFLATGLLTQAATAANISVIVDGQSYQCSGGSTPPVSQVYMYCKCLNSQNDPGEYYAIGLFAIESATGKQLWWRQVTSPYGSAASCDAALATHPQCRF